MKDLMTDDSDRIPPSSSFCLVAQKLEFVPGFHLWAYTFSLLKQKALDDMFVQAPFGYPPPNDPVAQWRPNCPFLQEGFPFRLNPPKNWFRLFSPWKSTVHLR